MKRVAELAAQTFLTDNKPNVKGIFMAGSADFKKVLNESDKFDKRLKDIIIATYDV